MCRSEPKQSNIGTFLGTGMIFRLGELKVVKNNQDNQIQNITLCNMYFFKKAYMVYNGDCKLQKKRGSRMYYLLPQCCGSSYSPAPFLQAASYAYGI